MTGMMRIDDRKGNSMIFIGITGGVGAGKSAVLSYLKELDGVKVMLSDEIAHELMEPGSDCYNRLRNCLRANRYGLRTGILTDRHLPE
jgi:dephospho-CoA kinase